MIDNLRGMLPHAPMLREDTLRALGDESLLQGLVTMAQMTGMEMDLKSFREFVTDYQPEQSATAKGKPIGGFDRYLGIYAP